jgi:uncharacterized repeat protein (TIGR03803 family)
MKKLYIICTFACILFSASSFAQFTKVLDFLGSTNGSVPQGDLISDSTFLYGLTRAGGTSNLGTIFKIKPDGTSYEKLLDFSGVLTGAEPYGSLIYEGAFLYGMASLGGTYNLGTIFKIKPDGTGFARLLSFGETNGSYPLGSLISDGTYLYGMTDAGGQDDYGTIFKIKLDGTGYVKLIDFYGGANGKYPQGSFISDGTYLYGMTSAGGTNGLGTIFKIKLDGTGYVKLLDFAGVTNGSYPQGSLVSDGTYLYGMTSQGGLNDDGGVLFKIKPDGTGYAKLLNFDGTINGERPRGCLFFDGTFLYGTTFLGTTNPGTLFKIKSDGTGYAKLIDFVGTTNGKFPTGTVISDGTFLYGMTSEGGTNGLGVIYKYALPVGINELSNINNQLLIYPNPTKNSFTISINTEMKNAHLAIYNVLGEKIYNAAFNKEDNTIDVKQLASGIYLVEVRDGQKLYSQKISVQ